MTAAIKKAVGDTPPSVTSAGSGGASRFIAAGAHRRLLMRLRQPTARMTKPLGRVTAIGRRKLSLLHPKLTQVRHPDFADCSALAETLSGQDAAIFCLGTYTGAVSDAELRNPATAWRRSAPPDPVYKKAFGLGVLTGALNTADRIH